ncbi:MAG: patatin family protein [Firmicutes bacterium]|nr:patatin family protein [Bacillota bacterium]
MVTKVGLVLEGGAMRGMYTAGVLDTFMDNNIKIDGIVGVSAGALFGVNYFSKQKGRVIRYSKKYCRDLRYMSLPSLIFTGNIVNKHFAFYKVSQKLDIFDNETYVKNKKEFYAVVTNIENGKAEYLKIDNCIEQLEALRASSAMPMASKVVEINNKKYLDGGISDSIPIDKCLELGYDKIIVVLTRPLNYRKKPLSEKVVKTLKRKFRNYPNLVDTMEKRHKTYNEVVEKIIDLENKKEIFVIRPTEDINVNIIERSKDKLQKVYDLGVQDCKKQLEHLKKYLN